MTNKSQHEVQQFFTTNQKIDPWESWLVTLIRWTTLAVLVAPIVTFPSLLNPYTFSKTIIIYTLIQIAFGSYVVLVVRNRNYLPWAAYTDACGTSKRNVILLAAGGHFGALVLATVFAYDRYVSFWGNIDWTSGLVTYIHLFGLMMVILSVFREKEYWRWVLRMIVIVATLAALWATGQWLKGTEAFAFFGNRGYLAGFLLFGVFSTLALLWSDAESNDPEESKELLWAAAAVQLIVVLFITDVRSGMIGFVGGTAAMGMVMLLTHAKKNIRTVTAAVLGVIVASGLVVGGYLLQSGKITSLFERAATVKTRLFTWKVGLDALKDRPIFGYGLENYSVPFDQKFTPEYYAAQSAGVAFEFSAAQPHNKLIEVAATSGGLGIGTYLALYGVMIGMLFVRYRETKRKSYLALIGLWVSHLGHTFFLFDTITTYVLYFVLLAYTMMVVYDPKPVAGSSRPAHTNIQWGTAVGMTVLVLVGINYAVVLPVRANYQGAKAIRYLQRGEFQLMLERFALQDALGQRNIQERTIVGSADNVQSAIMKQKEVTEFHQRVIKKVIEYNEQVVSREPYVIFARLGLGGLYNLAGKRVDPNYYEKNIELQTESIRRSPGRPDLYYNIAESYFGLGQKEKGIEMMDRVITMAPDYAYSYYVYGLAYGQMKEYPKAIEYLEQAMSRGLADGPITNTFLEYTHQARQYDKAIGAAKRLIQLNPNDAQQLANLAMLYYETKDWNNAKDILKQLIEKYPAQKEQAEKMLKQIPAN